MTEVVERSALRMSGGGNDFLAFVEEGFTPSAEQVRAWCRRGVALGADGVFTLRRLAPGRVSMHHLNADGSVAELCVNGTRCAARLAFELGWAEAEVEIETGAGIARAWDRGAAVAIEAPLPAGPMRPLDLDDLLGHRMGAWLLVVGVPHLVVEWDRSLAHAPVAELGTRIRRDPRVGPAGTNVDFVTYPRPDRFEVRTFERGVEAETLACGSGLLAAAAVGWSRGLLGSQAEAVTLGGFPFAVEGVVVGGAVERWKLVGDARLVARLEILPGADATAAPPSWS